MPRHPPCALSSLTIKFTHEQQTSSIGDLKFQISNLETDLKFQTQKADPKPFTPEKTLVTYLLLYCACTVKLALCVSLLSDITPRDLRSEISDLKYSLRDVGQQSLFDCQRALVTSFDPLLMLGRNFSIQIWGA